MAHAFNIRRRLRAGAGAMENHCTLPARALRCRRRRCSGFAMLGRLDIRNFTIVESLSVEFAPGFTTITGETGAG
jgi:hypothetical protein